MTVWRPIGVLPNLSGTKVLEGGVIAIASIQDERVQAICKASPSFAELLSRFANAFGVPLRPFVLITQDDSLSVDAVLSFRDLAAISVVPYCRAVNTVYDTTSRIVYASSFWIYPWTLGRDNATLVMATPAFTGIHVVEAFHGQSSPELVVVDIDEVDTPLFDSLLLRWHRHYLGKRARWADRALFRSLSMAVQAASLPAGVGTSIFDLGRCISLWVSAFEVLAHRGKRKDNGLASIYSVLDRISYYCESDMRARRYAVSDPNSSRGKKLRRTLLFKVYSQLYSARNNFLHGNRVSPTTVSPNGTRNGLFWLAPCAYRLALTGFLNLVVDPELPYWLSPRYRDNPKLRKARQAYDTQDIIERALLRISKT